MASCLRLISSNLVTRRSLAPTLVSSASRFLSIDSHIADHPSNTIVPTDNHDCDDQSWLRIMCPKISSLSFEMEMDAKDRSLSLEIRKKQFSVDLTFPGLEKVDNTFLIKGKTNKESYLAGIKLPDKTSDGIKEDMKDGMLEVTPPKKDDSVTRLIANDIITSFCNITDEQRTWAYYDMFFDRSILGERLFPAISKLASINSFSIHKEETDSLEMHMNMPGLQRMKLTPKGVFVSLEMGRLEREDVNVYFDYDMLFIEGKTNKDHYITGIHIPKYIQRKHNMIKKEMIGKVFCATLELKKKKLR